jgi:hypothetical protein
MKDRPHLARPRLAQIAPQAPVFGLYYDYSAERISTGSTRYTMLHDTFRFDHGQW